jgi:hypothetical protein
VELSSSKTFLEEGWQRSPVRLNLVCGLSGVGWDVDIGPNGGILGLALQCQGGDIPPPTRHWTRLESHMTDEKVTNANRAADLLLGIDHALERRLSQRIAILKVEAEAHGDSEQVQLCNLALNRRHELGGTTLACRRLALRVAEARAACVEVLADAEAQIDDDGQLDLFAE